MNPLFRTIEILLIIVLPLLVFYQRSNWPSSWRSINCALIPIVWYITYAPIHEFSHMLGCFVVGANITDYRLFAHFWEGNFGFAYVEIQDGYSYNLSSLIILIFPYILDFVSIAIGYFILKRYSFINSFVAGFLFMLLLLRPLYDLVDNYIGIFYNHSDLVMIGDIIGYPVTFLYGIITILTSLYIIYYVLRRYKGLTAESDKKVVESSMV